MGASVGITQGMTQVSHPRISFTYPRKLLINIYSGYTDPELTTVLLILLYPNHITDRAGERLFAFSILSPDLLNERRASEDDLWRRRW